MAYFRDGLQDVDAHTRRGTESSPGGISEAMNRSAPKCRSMCLRVESTMPNRVVSTGVSRISSHVSVTFKSEEITWILPSVRRDTSVTKFLSMEALRTPPPNSWKYAGRSVPPPPKLMRTGLRTINMADWPQTTGSAQVACVPGAIRATRSCSGFGEQVKYPGEDRKSTRLNSSHLGISYA